MNGNHVGKGLAPEISRAGGAATRSQVRGWQHALSQAMWPWCWDTTATSHAGWAPNMPPLQWDPGSSRARNAGPQPSPHIPLGPEESPALEEASTCLCPPRPHSAPHPQAAGVPAFIGTTSRFCMPEARIEHLLHTHPGQAPAMCSPDHRRPEFNALLRALPRGF